MKQQLLLERTTHMLEHPPVPVVYLSAILAAHTADLLDSFAVERPSEGVVYWYGLELGGRAVVTTLVVPDADTESGAVQTSAAANAQTLEAILDTPLQLLGQAHSHPSSYVQHSPTDDAETFARFEGMISVVVPYFGRYGLHIDCCGVYRFIQGGFHLVRPTELNRHLVILPGKRDFRSVQGGVSATVPSRSHVQR
jgi:hypothetical protein